MVPDGGYGIAQVIEQTTLLELMTQRGFHRGRDLGAALDAFLAGG